MVRLAAGYPLRGCVAAASASRDIRARPDSAELEPVDRQVLGAKAGIVRIVRVGDYLGGVASACCYCLLVRGREALAWCCTWPLWCGLKEYIRRIVLFV